MSLVEHNSTSHWCCRLWITAHHCGILYLISKLEAVQHFAAIVVTHRWHDSHSKLLASLKWPSLQKRRLKQKLSLCSRIVGDHSIIPPSFFTPHPSPNLRHVHSEALKAPRCKSTSHLHSFASSVVSVWNSLPQSIFMSVSLFSFKKSLHQLVI